VLVEVLAGAVRLLLVAGPFGSAAAKARPPGLGLLRLPIPFGAFPELFEIDGFPHDHLHHPNGRDGAKICAPRKLSRMVSINPVCIRKIPVASKKSGTPISRVKAAYFCALSRRNAPGTE
jgi:hypothetical protein